MKEIIRAIKATIEDTIRMIIDVVETIFNATMIGHRKIVITIDVMAAEVAL